MYKTTAPKCEQNTCMYKTTVA